MPSSDEAGPDESPDPVQDTHSPTKSVKTIRDITDKAERAVKEITDRAEKELTKARERAARLTEKLKEEYKEGKEKVDRLKEKVAEKLKEEYKEGKEKVDRLKEKVSRRVTAIRRKVITGSTKKRVRDFAMEMPVVKMVDKLSFTLGVITIHTTTWILCLHPELFHWWFCIVLPPMLVHRLYLFIQLKYQYTLYDFCYFVNFGCLIAIFYPNKVLYQLLFAYTTGPLLFAMIIYRNNMVFHSAEQLTSVLIHAFPALLTYTWRWWPSEDNVMCHGEESDKCELGPGSGMLSSLCWQLLGYFMWQLYYYYVTEIRDREILESRPDLVTSPRWMMLRKTGKTGFAGAIRDLCVRLGFYRPDEHYADNMKARVVFMVAQLVITVAFLLPTSVFFTYKRLHTVALTLCYVLTVWNGAGYYIEVFAAQYLMKFEQANKSLEQNSDDEGDDQSAKVDAGVKQFKQQGGNGGSKTAVASRALDPKKAPKAARKSQKKTK